MDLKSGVDLSVAKNGFAAPTRTTRAGARAVLRVARLHRGQRATYRVQATSPGALGVAVPTVIALAVP